MSIHHAIQQKAEKKGLIITENRAQFPDFGQHVVWPAGTVAVHWPQPNLWAFGVGAKPAMAEMEAIQQIKQSMHEDNVLINDPRDPFHVFLFLDARRDMVLIRGGATPADTLAALDDDATGWKTTTPAMTGDPEADGRAAFVQGFTAADNPYRDEDGAPIGEGSGDEDRPDQTEAADAWDAAFDAAADEEAEDTGEPTGSVVANRYRQRYKEEGHPNHCGDWLAGVFNNIVGDTKHLNVEALDELAELNGVNNKKYNRESPGWQGRLRMTTRNLIAPVAFRNKGINVPAHISKDGKLPAPSDWLAAQRFKRTEAAK